MKMIFVFLFVFYFFLNTVNAQDHLDPYEKYDSMQRASRQSLLIESGSFVNARFSVKAVYFVNLDDLFFISKYDANGYKQFVVHSEEKVLKKHIKKIGSAPDYKCLSEIRARDKKWLKGKDFKYYWRYRLVNEFKNGEGRVKRPLRNDCMSLFATIKERKLVRKILRELRQLPGELTLVK